MRLHVRDSPVANVDDWFRLAPPKGGTAHWREGRSALELARACCPASGGVVLPAEVQVLLNSHPLTAGLQPGAAKGSPELRVRVDGYAGEPRNTDLAFVYPVGEPVPRLVAVSVEAKADESFGQKVEAAIATAERRRARGKASNGDRRARELAAALLGPGASADAAVTDLRYQLLTGVAGALAFAKTQAAAVAVLVIFEFVDRLGRYTDPRNVAANSGDVDAFVARLSRGAHSRLDPDALIGPFLVPGNEHLPSDMPLLVGKTRRVLGEPQGG